MWPGIEIDNLYRVSDMSFWMETLLSRDDRLFYGLGNRVFGSVIELR